MSEPTAGILQVIEVINSDTLEPGFYWRGEEELVGPYPTQEAAIEGAREAVQDALEEAVRNLFEGK